MQRWAPDLANDTDEHLFGTVWRRTDLSPRDRSMVTITALIATGKTPQLEGHLGRALDNGVTPGEIAGIVTHLAYYTGWPNAVSALEVVDRVMRTRSIDPAGRRTEQPSAPVQIIKPDHQPQEGAADRFTGSVEVASSFGGTGGSRLSGATVTFQPGARTNWHSHALGQLLVVTSGEGRIQVEGGDVLRVRAGDVIWTAPGVRHWHGASSDRSFSHVAINEAAPGQSVTWGRAVSDDEYRRTAVESEH